jgi:hypothetical protein
VLVEHSALQPSGALAHRRAGLRRRRQHLVQLLQDLCRRSDAALQRVLTTPAQQLLQPPRAEGGALRCLTNPRDLGRSGVPAVCLSSAAQGLAGRRERGGDPIQSGAHGILALIGSAPGRLLGQRAQSRPLALQIRGELAAPQR